MSTFSSAKSILFQRHTALLVTNNALCLISGLVSGIWGGTYCSTWVLKSLYHPFIVNSSAHRPLSRKRFPLAPYDEERTSPLKYLSRFTSPLTQETLSCPIANGREHVQGGWAFRAKMTRKLSELVARRRRTNLSATYEPLMAFLTARILRYIAAVVHWSLLRRSWHTGFTVLRNALFVLRVAVIYVLPYPKKMMRCCTAEPVSVFVRQFTPPILFTKQFERHTMAPSTFFESNASHGGLLFETCMPMLAVGYSPGLRQIFSPW